MGLEPRSKIDPYVPARLKTAAELESLKAKPLLLGLFKEPVAASAMFKAFAEVATELPVMVGGDAAVAYSASYAADPVAEAAGFKAPAIIALKPGAEPVAMTIPRDRKLFTEELLGEWAVQQLK